ncbi:Formate-tetrahydrofolate ligase [Granulicatella balaenopterae]|uniref:Formate--tetrahydrofolate ligase n=1 Tax=Granulicatella balaenopterae TaxID=137733 RepID=A0A1H9GTL9_9LACT|nr:formate--tetrahydrofolate ligase [Granulicatella balaenopterae]SEQ53441.1 Formate-tetrahydrofolate ligase [Granulicatella balaenopterae]
MKKDIEIARAIEKEKIVTIAKKMNLTPDDLELYGNYKAKITLEKHTESIEQGKMVLVTAINPTPAGEGKSTVSIGLADAMNASGYQTVVALREPSLGPTLGIKGGATGGGQAQIVPMEDINLHFTGDIHAISTANNALSALIDNHIYQGNELQIDPRRITWKRVVDLNDRALRHVVVGLGGPIQGVPREDGFDITVASEIMAILCLAKDLKDLKERISQIVIGYTYDKEPISVKDLKVEGVITALLKDAIKPNLVQTLEHTPAIVHGGPFANIAHGCNSIIATKIALQHADYVITEAGFGADLGAEKFLDIKVPQLEKAPDAIVIVATIRSLKMHGGVSLADLAKGENIPAIRDGFSNLAKHIDSLKAYHVPVIVSLNEFTTDTKSELEAVKEMCDKQAIPCVETSIWANGSKGGLELAKTVVDAIQTNTNDYTPLIPEGTSMQEKIALIAKNTYGATTIEYSAKALTQIKQYQELGWGELPICMAKTQYSLSDNPKLLGRPTDFAIHIREFVPKIGAGFIVALTGNVMTMPGLTKEPAALEIDIDENGNISGLF